MGDDGADPELAAATEASGDENQASASTAGEPPAASAAETPQVEQALEEKAANGVSKPAGDDSDDDAPLKKTGSSAIAKKTVADDDSDDEAPVKAKAPAPTPKPAPADDSDSDDDKPLAAKLPPKKAAAPPKEQPKAKPEKKRKIESSSDEQSSDDSDSDSSSEDDVPLKKKVVKASKPKEKSSPSKSSGKATNNKGRPKEFTDKDWLIERYLVRWWYCEEWPPADRPRPDDLSEDFVEMEHYPYIYYNQKTGQVVSKRSDDNLPPCKKKMVNMTFDDIRHKVMLAITKQMEVLKEHEPENKQLQKELDKEMQEVKQKKAPKR